MCVIHIYTRTQTHYIQPHIHTLSLFPQHTYLFLMSSSLSTLTTLKKRTPSREAGVIDAREGEREREEDE
jgi:hypothetical protein